jgi:carboxyl-terminal processing protease
MRYSRGPATLIIAALLTLTALVAPALAEKRVALIIGNGAYQNAPRLPNPGNDAQDVAAALRRVGFETILGLDLDRAGMDDHAVRFARAARDADIAIFYYSGHAVQFNGVNYLAPVDAKLTDEADLRRLARVDDVVADLQQAKNLRILVLDSCRDNPLAEDLKRSIGRTRALPLTRGLAKIDSPLGMIVAYATQAGRTAEDGTGRNSPFTAAFLRHIEAPEEIGTVFRRVSADVYEATGRTQLPELSLSLIGEFYLRGQARLPASAAEPDAAAQAWAATKDTTSLAVLDDFIRQFGDTPFASMARARRDELRKGQVAVVTPSQPGPPATPPDAARPESRHLARADAATLFGRLFTTILDHVRKEFVEPPDESRLLSSAIQGMRNVFPGAQQVSSAGAAVAASTNGGGKASLNDVYDAAIEVLNTRATSADDERVVQAAIDGLLAAADPHSNYMNAQTFRGMQVQTRGEFGGVGTELTMQDGLAQVVAPIDDTPAAKAGMRAGDLVVQIDDDQVRGLTLNQVVEKMRGPVGTKVRLKLQRKGVDQPIEVSIERALIRIRAVRWRTDGDDVGVIRLTQFNQQTTEGLKKALAELQAQIPAGKLRGYIIDVRNNPGGLLDQAIQVADAFLESGEIVSTRGRNADATQRFNAQAGDLAKGKPLIVLINGGSAAASEIVAGALQDHKRATIVGTRSFGKGSVQTIIPLGNDNGALRLTTARYYTPSGRSIQATGVVPDVEVLQDVPDEVKAKSETKGEAALRGHLSGQGPEQGGSQSYVPPDSKDDKALIRALALLRKGR